MSAIPKTTAPQIRPMRETDLAAVMRIEVRAYDYPWTYGIFQDCLRYGYCCWVFERDDCVDGYGVMSIAAGEAHILNLCVRPEVRRHGLGRKILNYLVDLARRHDADSVLLEVRPSNRAAVSLYHELGFNEVGTRRNYYPAENGREDAMILAKTLLRD
jgi:[ribosomal protein S18]-alanine N-acetyltransferase